MIEEFNYGEEKKSEELGCWLAGQNANMYQAKRIFQVIILSINYKQQYKLCKVHLKDGSCRLFKESSRNFDNGWGYGVRNHS